MMERREEQERNKIRGTPSKVAVGTGRLSVPQPGTAPTSEKGDEMDADIECVYKKSEKSNTEMIDIDMYSIRSKDREKYRK